MPWDAEGTADEKWLSPPKDTDTSTPQDHDTTPPQPASKKMKLTSDQVSPGGERTEWEQERVNNSDPAAAPLGMCLQEGLRAAEQDPDVCGECGFNTCHTGSCDCMCVCNCNEDHNEVIGTSGAKDTKETPDQQGTGGPVEVPQGAANKENQGNAKDVAGKGAGPKSRSGAIVVNMDGSSGSVRDQDEQGGDQAAAFEVAGLLNSSHFHGLSGSPQFVICFVKSP